MPRVVDHRRRRNEILDAAGAVLADTGYANLSLRAIAARMGGSSTLVTHYYRSRDQLIRALTSRVCDEMEAEARDVLDRADPNERLRAALGYFVPNDRESTDHERIRIALLPYQGAEPAVGEFFERIEHRMRSLLRDALDGLVDDRDRETVAGYLRIWVNGIALSAVEHPELWDPEQLHDAVDWFVDRVRFEAPAR